MLFFHEDISSHSIEWVFTRSLIDSVSTLISTQWYLREIFHFYALFKYIWYLLIEIKFHYMHVWYLKWECKRIKLKSNCYSFFFHPIWMKRDYIPLKQLDSLSLKINFLYQTCPKVLNIYTCHGIETWEVGNGLFYFSSQKIWVHFMIWVVRFLLFYNKWFSVLCFIYF